MRKAQLLAGRLGMKIEHHSVGDVAQRAGFKDGFSGRKRIVEVGMHEHPPHHIRHHHPCAISGDVEI
jgi:hypothetical protein